MTLPEKEAVKRAGIYAIDDSSVDDYIIYQLADLQKSTDRLVVVVNGQPAQPDREKLEKVTREIAVSHGGGNAAAFRQGANCIGWKALEQYDELVYMDNSCYGPFYPFREAFDEMAGRDLDFWGLTAYQGDAVSYPEQYFHVYRSSLVSNADFKKYWEGPPGSDGGRLFTERFANKGFVWDVYVGGGDLKGYTDDPLQDYPKKLLCERRCPVLKRSSFFRPYAHTLSRACGEEIVEAFSYIRSELSYDTNMIWDNLLRRQNMADIKNQLHLNYILPTACVQNPGGPRAKVALVMHLHYPDLIEHCFKYARSMPEYADIYIATTSMEMKGAVEKIFSHLKCNKLEVMVKENRGRDVSSLLVGVREVVMDYDLVCFVHDKKTTQIKPHSVGESWSYRCFENLLKNRNFVENVIDTFNTNPRLGLLTPPPPNHSHYYEVLGKEWGSEYKNAKKLAKQLKLRTDITDNKEPIAPLGTMFWFKPLALKVLYDYGWDYNDFPPEPIKNDDTILHVIERIYPYVVQHEGYYSAWLLSDTFACIELTNITYMLRELNIACMRIFGVTSGQEQLLENISYRSSLSFHIKKILKMFIPAPLIKPLKRMLKGEME